VVELEAPPDQANQAVPADQAAVAVEIHRVVLVQQDKEILAEMVHRPRVVAVAVQAP
jgi:hypothetical protein